jgi:ribose transport system permease protein
VNKLAEKPPESKVSLPDVTGRVGLARHEVIQLAERGGLLVLLVATLVGFSIGLPNTFATVANFQNLGISEAVLVVVGLALLFPLVGGRFDVSVGSNLGLCAIAVAALMGNHHWSLVPAIIATLAIGAFIGAVNGVIVAYLGVNSIIATIGTGTIMGGLVQAYTNGIPISDGLSPTLTTLSAKTVFKVPDLFIIAMGLSIVVWFVLTQTPYGRKLLATGDNLSAARLTGLRVHWLVFVSFVAAGMLAGVGGVLQVAAQGSGDPTIGGLPFMLPALAAVFLGATTWRPGTYNVPGMLVGLFFVGSAVSGLVLLGVATWVTSVFNGAVVVVAVVISAELRRRRTGNREIGS